MKPRWRALIREPLLHFLLAGLVLWLLAAQHRRAADQYRIVIRPDRVEQLKNAYTAEFGSPPADTMLPRLIDDYVGAEILFREGMARGLDRNDEIVRRRVIQKVEFLEKDLAVTPEPGEAELRDWHARHAARFVAPGRIAFSHVFFAADGANAGQVRARALSVLAQLPATMPRAADKGDSFPDLHDFAGFGADDARRLFGESEISEALFAAPVGQWAGPFRSAYGWHLVRLSRAEAGGRQAFSAVRDTVRADYIAKASEAANARRLAKMRARYTVVRE